MSLQQIFKGLNVSQEVARDLATYQRVADGVIGVIDANGHLVTNKGTWNRPMADQNFKVLKEALGSADFAIVRENCIFVDFPALAYNLEWVCQLIQKENLGVMNSNEGLLLFKKKESTNNQSEWYHQLYWALRGVSMEDLELPLKLAIVSLSPTPENPDEAKWEKLYFID